MYTVGLILTNLDALNLKGIERMFIEKADRIILIFIEKEKWFYEATSKKKINKILNETEKLVLCVNRRTNVVKIVLFGDDSSKLQKCFADLKIDFLITCFNNKKRNGLSRLFKSSFVDKICEDLKIPVLITQNKK